MQEKKWLNESSGCTLLVAACNQIFFWFTKWLVQHFLLDYKTFSAKICNVHHQIFFISFNFKSLSWIFYKHVVSIMMSLKLFFWQISGVLLCWNMPNLTYTLSKCYCLRFLSKEFRFVAKKAKFDRNDSFLTTKTANLTGFNGFMHEKNPQKTPTNSMT